MKKIARKRGEPTRGTSEVEWTFFGLLTLSTRCPGKGGEEGAAQEDMKGEEKKFPRTGGGNKAETTKGNR